VPRLNETSQGEVFRQLAPSSTGRLREGVTIDPFIRYLLLAY